MARRPNKQHAISDLLHRLGSADAGPAWVEFIDRYSGLMMKTVYRFEYGQDRAEECFLYICEKLYDQDFKRLQAYNTSGGASFANWLSAVVFNLCVDWHRAEFGRATMLPAIAALPAFDQQVYQCHYEQGLNNETCFQTLKSEFPELTRDQVSRSLGRIHGLLTPRQRWQLTVRYQRRQRAATGDSSRRLAQLHTPESRPEETAQTIEQDEQLQTAMRNLQTRHRLLLHLRFQEGLTFKQIARIEHLGDPHRARRHVHAALEALQRRLQAIRSGRKRQT